MTETLVRQKDSIDALREYILKWQQPLERLRRALSIADTRGAGGSYEYGTETFVDPSEMRVAVANLRYRMVEYITSIRNIFKEKAICAAAIRHLLPIVDKKTLVPHTDITYKNALLILAGVISSVVFENVIYPTLAAGDDVGIDTIRVTAIASGMAYSKARKHGHKKLLEYEPYRGWYNAVFSRLNDTLSSFLADTSLVASAILNDALDVVAAAVFTQHCIWFAAYPRPDLIFRESGSTNCDMCCEYNTLADATVDVDIKNAVIAFTILPGVYFDDTVQPAVVYTVSNRP